MVIFCQSFRFVVIQCLDNIVSKSAIHHNFHIFSVYRLWHTHIANFSLTFKPYRDVKQSLYISIALHECSHSPLLDEFILNLNHLTKSGES